MKKSFTTSSGGDASCSSSRSSKAIRLKFFSIDAKNDGFQEDFSLPLSWRDDSEISLSDWTIEANVPKNTDDNDDETTRRTYHVHRAILGAGSRKCQYFTSLFQQWSSNNTHVVTSREHEDCTSRIDFSSVQELEELEILLDFLYSGKFVPGDNAVISRHLAFYFQCMEFMTKVNQFISRDLTPQRAPWYLLEATKYGDDRLVASATSMCSQAFQDVSDASLELLPVELFQSILCNSAEFQCSSKVLSLKVHAYLSSRRTTTNDTDTDVTPRLLYDLTKDELMPELDALAARGFLRLVKGFDAQSDDWSLLHSLCKRCTDAIALHGWKTMDVERMESDFGGGTGSANNNCKHSWKEEGKWHQESDFALLAMTSALARAQEVCTMQEWEIQNLRNQLQQQQHHRSSSPPPIDCSTSSLNYFNQDVLEVLDATIEETVVQTLGDYLQNHQHQWARESPRGRLADL